MGTLGFAWAWASPVKSRMGPIRAGQWSGQTTHRPFSPCKSHTGPMWDWNGLQWAIWASPNGSHSDSSCKPIQIPCESHTRSWNGQYGLAHSNPAWAPPGLAILDVARLEIFSKKEAFFHLAMIMTDYVYSVCHCLNHCRVEKGIFILQPSHRVVAPRVKM